MNKEDTKVADIFTEDINNLTEHLNIVITAHNKQLELIDQLTNNWNELEEWLKSYIALFDNPDTLEEQTLEDLKEVLDKMKEIKGGKDVSNNN